MFHGWGDERDWWEISPPLCMLKYVLFHIVVLLLPHNTLFIKKPVKVRPRLAVLSFSRILRLNCFIFVLKLERFRQSGNT